MAKIAPFQAFRYSPKAGPLQDLVTQPYDKISPAMQARYLSLNPHNLVRVILGERFDRDTEADNVYTRAAGSFNDWVQNEILVKDPEPSLYAYFQEFTVPDSGETLIRKGFIGLGAVEDYSASIVHRHEQTLSGPKKDRRQVLQHTRAHFGQIFMLYQDAECRIDSILDQTAVGDPVACVRDEYDTVHKLYRISDPDRIREIQEIMSDKKLVIADGHHRYETALAFKNDHPELEDARFVMMTFVNMHSRGLRILATHRVVQGLTDFHIEDFLEKVSDSFTVLKVDEPGTLIQLFEQPDLDKIRIGVAYQGGDGLYLLERPREGGIDVQVLHEVLIEKVLGISAEAVREESFIKYVRGMDAALDAVANNQAQIAFLLEPTTIQQVADTSFGGGVMPQKSTDFYPKLLTGLTIYKLEK